MIITGPILFVFSSCCFLINTPDSKDDRKINKKVISFNDFAVCLVVALKFNENCQNYEARLLFTEKLSIVDVTENQFRPSH